jgi:hypothetical protein
MIGQRASHNSGGRRLKSCRDLGRPGTAALSVRGVFRIRLFSPTFGPGSSRAHSFVDEVRPGTMVRIDDDDWVIIEVRSGPNGAPEVICRPVYERL